MLPILGHSSELFTCKENYISEFTKHCENIQIADIAWKAGDLNEAWRLYCFLSENVQHPLFQSGIFLKKALLAHELGYEEEIEENTRIFIKSFIIESGLKINEDDLEITIKSAKNILVKNAEKFKQLFFAMYDSLAEE